MKFNERTRKQRTFIVVAVALLASSVAIAMIAFPPVAALDSVANKVIILYYDYGNMPFQVFQFPSIVNFTLDHGFNTLMLVVFIDDEAIFNSSTIHYFASYSESRGLTFVPSYYIQSTNDQTGNLSGFEWVNLDMERLNTIDQSIFYNKIARAVPLVSVTSPYNQFVEFHSPMNIIETYAPTPNFWFMQLTYWHTGTICSIGVWKLHSQQEYDSEVNYCLHYTDGVMVFDYYNLLKSGFS